MAMVKKGLNKPVVKKAISKNISLIEAMKKARELGARLVRERKLKPL